MKLSEQAEQLKKQVTKIIGKELYFSRETFIDDNKRIGLEYKIESILIEVDQLRQLADIGISVYIRNHIFEFIKLV